MIAPAGAAAAVPDIETAPGTETVLGIETSCDETAAAVVAGGHQVRSSVVTSQIDLHRAFGGVVPEIAGRAHLELLPAAVEQALAEAGLEIPDQPPAAVAATAGPGLLGALVVGVSAAKALALAWDVPFVAVNHLEAHLYAAFLDGAAHTGAKAGADNERGSGACHTGDTAGDTGAGRSDGSAIPTDSADDADRTTDPAGAGTCASIGAAGPTARGPSLPMIVLLVSGGHTMLIEMTGHGRYELLGQTLDGRRRRGLRQGGSPAGPRLPGRPGHRPPRHRGATPQAVRFPRPMAADGLDFSFSGLKTAVAVHLRRHPATDRAAQTDIAASFQRAVVDVLETKTLRAAEARGISSLCLAGGVAANSELRARFEALGAEDYQVFIPTRPMCTDNAAMVAAAGWHQLQRQGPSDLGAAPKASWLIH